MRKGVRQGDVLLVPVPAVKGERIRPVKRRYTVAEGEQTGHHHSVAANRSVAAFLGPEGQFLDGSITLKHQEHTEHTVDGPYEVVLQRRASDHDVQRAVD